MTGFTTDPTISARGPAVADPVSTPSPVAAVAPVASVLVAEPVAVGAAVVALSTSVVSAGDLLHVWHLAQDAQSAITLVVVNVVALVAALLVRRRVTPAPKP